MIEALQLDENMEEEAGDKKQVDLNGVENVEGEGEKHGLGEKVEVKSLESTEFIEQLVLDESHEDDLNEKEDMERTERESARN